jgi:transcription antitermination protein NusB
MCPSQNENEYFLVLKDEEVLCCSLSLSEQRACVFHLLYAMEAFDYSVSLESISENLSRGFSCTIRPTDSVFKQAQAIIDKRNYLDAQIIPLLDKWRFERLGVCTRLILRLALWEFINTQLDPSVIINEAIELPKSFAETDAYKFINGILDEWLKKRKSLEGIK